MTLPLLAGFVVSALVTSLLVPVAARVAVVFGVLDHPGGRRQMESSVPRLGGPAIASGILAGAATIHLLTWQTGIVSWTRHELLAVVLGTALIFLVGLFDDVVRLSALNKFLVQLLAAWILVQAGFTFERLTLPFVGATELGAVGDLISVIWIIGVTNAINLLDGLDGLASGIVAIIGASFTVYALMQGNWFATLFGATLVGACLGFLYHNWEPAQIFMGDSGSLTLGFLLAAISVQSSLKAPAAVAILIPILALGVPVIDTLLVMVERFFGRQRRGLQERFSSMFRPDTRHIHHVLSKSIASRKQTVGLLYALVLFSCVLSLTVAMTRNPGLGIAFLVVGVVGVSSVRWMRSRRRSGGMSRRIEFPVEAAREDDAA